MAADDSHLCADPLVVQAWVTGWALARETPPPVPEAGGLRVDVGWPLQRARYVFPNPSEGLRCLAETIVEPWIFLKVCAPPEATRAILPPRWVIEPLGFMMTYAGRLTGAAPTLPDGYTFELTENLPVPIARVLTADGDVAAIGRVALTGDFAIYDRIETHQGHRRRGLGRAVMKSLEAIAQARGQTRGVLVATADGRAFYETLGWRMHSLYTTAVIPGPTSS
jgi:GNAT superfamily N-acetyltransferase